jgi:hypothetical protein
VSRLPHESRHRRVFPVLLLHASGGFLVVRAFEALSRVTGLGGGLQPIVVHLVVGVLALALALAWIFGVTPEGIRAVLDESTDGLLGEEDERRPWIDLRVALTAFLMIALGMALGTIG